MFFRRYDLAAKLGEGSFGEVRAIRAKSVAVGDSPPSELPLAVKMVRADGELERAEAVHEKQNWQLVGDHKHCVRLLESFAEDRVFYFVMDRCDLPLTAIWKGTALCDAEVARVFREMTLGVAHLHSLRLVHRDVKPSNFLLAGDGSVKLCDFGLSALLPESPRCMLLDVCGTASYMSPELLRGSGYREKTDVWSLGATAYRLLLGEDPYKHSPTDAVEPASRSSKARAIERAILEDKPKPSFSPVGGSGKAPQSASLSFVRLLLTRAPAERCSAAQALRHALFRKCAEQRAGATLAPGGSRAISQSSQNMGEASCSTQSPASISEGNSLSSDSVSDVSQKLVHTDAA